MQPLRARAPCPPEYVPAAGRLFFMAFPYRGYHLQGDETSIFLKQLKRAGVPHAQLLHFYVALLGQF